MDYYKQHNMLGGFLNDADGTLMENNCEYVNLDCGFQVCLFDLWMSAPANVSPPHYLPYLTIPSISTPIRTSG